MVAFVYSLPGIKDGRATQWSHMAGVVAEHRNAGLGRELKSMQRDRALAMGIDLIECTYDPLQAMNAHLNFAKLGVVVDEYAVNLYGESSSPLHRGLPTDRFVAQWRIQTPHVVRRLEASGPAGRTQGAAARPLELRAHDVASAARANGTAAAGDWLECTDVNVDLETDRVAVEIPVGFTEMLSGAPEQAQRWRLAARRLFMAYFARGYQAVDFFLDRGAGKGTYLLARH
jgi:predicted GNAT superfamily acetyltransferase